MRYSLIFLLVILIQPGQRAEGFFWKKKYKSAIHWFVGAFSSEMSLVDGPRLDSKFKSITGLAVNSSGDVYVADRDAANIRVIKNNKTQPFVGQYGRYGAQDGTGSGAMFSDPHGMDFDSSGNLFVADSVNHAIRKVTPSGVVTTFAGSLGSSGFMDGTGAAAQFNYPTGIFIMPNDDMYVVDENNYAIRKITSSGQVTTVVGGPSKSDCVAGTGAAAEIGNSTSIVADSVGNMFVTGSACRVIWKITPAGVVTIFAGQTGVGGGFANGTGSAARFEWPRGIAIDSSDNLYVGDYCRIRKITPGAVVSTFAGSSNCDPGQDGTGAGAVLSDVTVLSNRVTGGAFYFVDQYGLTVRRITTAAVVSRYAGRMFGSDPEYGNMNGTGSAVTFGRPEGFAFDSNGNLYVADTDNLTIRKVTPAGVVSTVAGSAGLDGSADGTGSAARFIWPFKLSVGSDGNIYIADGTRIRKMTPAGVVTTLAGAYEDPGFLDGTGGAARFDYIEDITSDASGNLYVADACAIRKVTLAGVVTTMAGVQSECAYTNGTLATARFNYIRGLRLDASGNLFVLESQTIRKISGGNVSLFAGADGEEGHTDGSGAAARFQWNYRMAIDGGGNLYVSSQGKAGFRRVTPTGVVTSFATTQPGSPDDDIDRERYLIYGETLETPGDSSALEANGHKLFYRGNGSTINWLPLP